MQEAEAGRDNDFRIICEVAREAGALLMEHFGQSVETWEKAPGNPVSQVDLAADDLIKRRLLTCRPDYGWLSEETADDPARLRAKRLWLVDPLDGTRAYLKGKDGFCVSIALVEDGRPVLGCVFAPVRGLFFTARAGRGASLNGAAIRVAGASAVEGCRMMADQDLFRWKHWPEPWPPMIVDKPNSVALRLALVASGDADAALSLTAKSEWDVAAAALLLEEAGGLMTDHLGETPRFNRESPILPTLVAANPRLHEPLRKRAAAGVARYREISAAQA